MTARLTVYTLGQFIVFLDGRPLSGLSSRTSEALLLYLMFHRQPVPRQVLADFFWDERTPDQAAANLRALLTMLRKTLGDYLLIDRHNVAFNHEMAYWLDAQELEREMARLEPHIHALAPLTAVHAAALQTAVHLYQGPFLAGFHLSESRGFDEWTLLTQERLRHRVETGLRRLVAYYLDHGLYEQGRACAAQLLALDPYYEAAHRQMMWLLARSGQRNAALDHYQRCRRLLADDLAVEPAPATTAVYHQIRALDFPPPCRLPPQTTPFVGREPELTAVRQQLSRPDCRLLSLLGPGGVGKTRLAIETAAQLWQQQPGLFLHGVYFIPLDTATTAAQLPLLLAEKLNLSWRGPAAPLEQLLNYLRDKETLLILDNLEHLLEKNPAETAALLASLLQEAPQIKLFVTSRHRLHLQEEWLIDLAGLDYPADGPPAPGDPSPPHDAYSAVQFFVQQGRRVRHQFAPDQADLAAIVRLCQVLEGLPLGLELAAVWLRHLSCAEIAAQAARQPDSLRSQYHNVAERQRSLTAVFDHSWNLLGEAERRALPRLTLFRGSFTQAAASAIAGADPALLHSLVDKSLLRLEENGRYALHTLIRQFSAAHLPPAERQATANAHAHFYAERLQTHQVSLDGPQAETALAELRQERPNLHAAWEWGLAERDAPLLERMVGELAYLDDLQGAYQAGYERLTAVSGAWLQQSEIGQRLDGRCRTHQARFAQQLGRYDEADALFRESVARLRPLDAPAALALALTYWGELARYQGDLAAARPRHAESLALFQTLNDQQGVARALLHQGNLAFVSGAFAEAAERYEAGLAICLALGGYRQTAVFLDNLGAAWIDLGEYDKAETALTGALTRRETINDRWGLATSGNNLGVLAGMRGQYEQSEKRYQAAAALYRELGYSFGVARCLCNLGSMLVSQGNLAEAQRHLLEALSLWQTLGVAAGEADALFYLGRAQKQQGAYGKAARLLRESATLYRQTEQSGSLLLALADLSVAFGRLGREDEAQAILAEALALAQTTGTPVGLLRVVLAGADMLARKGDMAEAARWFALAQNHSQATQPLRDEAAHLRRDWPQLPETPSQKPPSLTALPAKIKSLCLPQSRPRP